jgi:hypothetical protein
MWQRYLLNSESGYTYSGIYRRDSNDEFVLLLIGKLAKINIVNKLFNHRILSLVWLINSITKEYCINDFLFILDKFT